MLLATLCILLSTILTTHPSAAKKLTDLFPRDGLCGLSMQERLDTLRNIKEFEADDADGQDADGQDADGQDADDDGQDADDDGQDADDDGQDADADDDAGLVTVPQCGAGLWLPIANFDVTGADTDCPPGWTFTDAPMRGCFGENSNSAAGGCDMVTFPTGGVSYNKVCGRISGRGTGSPVGFFNILMLSPTFDTTVTQFDGVVPADGVTLTYSTPAEHIWTFAAATINAAGDFSCPCNPETASLNVGAVEFADNNYFCDIADTQGRKVLWISDCGLLQIDVPDCCNVNGPPFFVSTLTSPTSANVDARLCLDGNAGMAEEALFVQRMELYVQ